MLPGLVQNRYERCSENWGLEHYTIDGKVVKVIDELNELVNYQVNNNNITNGLNGLYFITIHYCNGLIETKKQLFIN